MRLAKDLLVTRLVECGDDPQVAICWYALSGGDLHRCLLVELPEVTLEFCVAVSSRFSYQYLQSESQGWVQSNLRSPVHAALWAGLV